MNEHYEAIMDAGKTEEGQVVLPLLFRYNVFILDKSQLKQPDMQLESWEEVVGCGDDKLMSFLRGRMIRGYCAQYDRFIDYKNEELLLTEEAIATDMHAFSDVQPLTTDESSTFEIAMRKTMDEFALAEYVSCPDSAMVLPLPNTSGGLTAYITAYAAINRNSEYAGDAFRFIELMLSDEVQSDIGICEDSMGITYSYGNGCRPSTTLLDSVSGVATGKNACSEEENIFLAGLVDRTSAVRFCSDIDTVLLNAARSSCNSEDPDEIAARVYDEMKMIIAE